MNLSLPPIGARLRAVAEASRCGAALRCTCHACAVATSADVIGRGVAVHPHPFQRLCWLLNNVLEHPEHPDADHTPALLRAIVPVLTREECVDALTWNPHPWGGGHLLRSNLLIYLDLVGE